METRSNDMIKRLVWMGTGYVAGAASSWWVQRKVRRTAERVLPEAVRNEVTARVGGTVETLGKTIGSTVGRARTVVEKARPDDMDLRDRHRAIS